MNPEKLPVYSQKQRILDVLKDHQVVVVESPTGSGKTTQLPVILHEAGYADSGMIGVTQPRRIAVVSVCRFIARQMDSVVGGIVGYKMRFEDMTGNDTRVKIVTDGTLLQEMKGDRWLSKYSVLMIDEAHERTLNIDFILGLVKDILPHRPELKILVSSATLNPKAFSVYFDNCPVVTINTPVYPVDIFYEPPSVEGDEEILIEKIAQVVEKITGRGRSSGDILIFCTGERMIKDAVAKLLASPMRRELQVMPLYGRLGSEEQEKVFDSGEKGKIKVVVSTNVAETSITIDGITAVVDTGLAKMNFYNPRTYTSSLIETPISRAAANQRKGRAGRTRAGICYRLYPEVGFESRPKYTQEEIYRTDLAEVVLRMAEIGIRDFESFPFISLPNAKGIHGAVEALRLLDALDEKNELTDIGKRMVPYPLMPRHARMIVEAVLRYPDVIKEVIITASFLSTNAPWLLPQGEEMEARNAHHAFRSKNHGDFATYLNLYWDYVDASDRVKFAASCYLDKKILDEILAIVDQLEEITSRGGVPIGEGGSSDDFIKACARGLMPFVCVKNDRFGYRSVSMDRIMIHPGSTLFRGNPELIIAGEIVHTSRTYARSVSPLRQEWLAQIHPELPDRLFPELKNGRQHGGNSKNDSSQTDERKRKDTTNQIWVAGEAFPLIRSDKGNKKRAVAEWSRLHKALIRAENDPFPDFRGSMRGTLLLGEEVVLPDSKMSTLVKVAKRLDPRKDILEAAPRGNFHLDKEDHRNRLVHELKNLPGVVRGGKKQKKSGMGFLSLYSNGEGCYWFKSIKSFHRAVSVSLESLEHLADVLTDELDDSRLMMLEEACRRMELLQY